MKQKINWKVLCIGIVCLSAIEIVALMKGVDGTIMSLIIGVIGLAMGLTLPQLKLK